MDGTSLARFKASVITELSKTLTNVSYESFANVADILGEDGSAVAVCWSDEVHCQVTIPVLKGLPIWYDETYPAQLIIQAIGRDTDEDVSVLDARATEALGHVVGLLATNPEVSIANDSNITMFAAVLKGWTYNAGLANSNTRAVRYAVDIEVTDRITLTTV